MNKTDYIQRAKDIAQGCMYYGKMFENVPFLTTADAMKVVEPCDIILEYIPQLKPDVVNFNEYVLKGCMHICMLAKVDEQIFKVELIQKGLFCSGDIFYHLEPYEIFLKRYFVVLRSKSVVKDDALRQGINASALKLGGYKELGGLPVKTREVKSNFFLKTHKVENISDDNLPKKLYCSEHAYLSYKENGVDICKLYSADELMKLVGGYPSHGDTKRILKMYARTSKKLYYVGFLITEFERLMARMKMDFMRPFKIMFPSGVWPNFVLENKEFDIVAVIPPEEVFLDKYNK